MTFMFLLIILGATDERAPKRFAPIAIGLGLTLIHLISIPVTNTSVNPARSTGPALIVGGWALAQLWLFWAAPFSGLCWRDWPTVGWVLTKANRPPLEQRGAPHSIVVDRIRAERDVHGSREAEA